MRKNLFANLFLASLLTGSCLQAKDWDARARELVGKMTLPEKIQELHGIKDATHYLYVPPIPRLGIPAFHIANGPAGVGPAGDDPQNLNCFFFRSSRRLHSSRYRRGVWANFSRELVLSRSQIIAVVAACRRSAA